jgi:ribosome-associated heat shock protein Hsp15
MNTTEDRQRLDKWLWAARFFKTRALAAEAINGGKVHLNGERTKPGRTIKVMDQLVITRGYMEYSIIVQALSKHRRPAKEAALLYEETADSIQAREQRMAEVKAQTALMPHAPKRPSKKDRRQIVRFQRKQS